jgi:hypothetical protein
LRLQFAHPGLELLDEDLLAEDDLDEFIFGQLLQLLAGHGCGSCCDGCCECRLQ